MSILQTNMVTATTSHVSSSMNSDMNPLIAIANCSKSVAAKLKIVTDGLPFFSFTDTLYFFITFDFSGPCWNRTNHLLIMSQLL